MIDMSIMEKKIPEDSTSPPREKAKGRERVPAPMEVVRSVKMEEGMVPRARPLKLPVSCRTEATKPCSSLESTDSIELTMMLRSGDP